MPSIERIDRPIAITFICGIALPMQPRPRSTISIVINIGAASPTASTADACSKPDQDIP